MKFLLFFSLIFTCFILNAQPSQDSLVSQGTSLHDAGKYAEAIEVLKEALKVDSTSFLANYEISLSYLYNQQYDESINHSDYIIKNSDDTRFRSAALMTKASALDAGGKPEKAIRVYKEALKLNPENYLLQYNIALTYSNMGEKEKAETAAIQAISLNPNHASSHLLLGYLMYEQEKKVQSILSLHFFLFLEANSKRSTDALKTLLSQFQGSAVRDSTNALQILINSQAIDKENEFGPAELMISMLSANRELPENKQKTNEELFIHNTTAFFSTLGELREKDEDKTGLWWDFYVRFFYEMAQSSHMEAYCHYILLSTNEVSAAWLNANPEKVAAFDRWLSER